ncbi:MAG: SRPBCC family protein [Chloroflexi bacterium]|nr:SRPBCC family protein [Chloroflexota bacterium]MCI0886133.1 SRPBCC family protein [Chloroflexota bacterium]
MTRILVETRVDAPRERVWDIIADLGAVSTWHPALADSRYTSEAKEGLEASRRCDFPDGGFVNESVIEWKPGEAFTLEISGGTVPFASAKGTMSVSEDGDGTIVTLALDYELKSDIPVDPQELERENREDLLPLVLAGLKHYVETGKPLPMPVA